MASPAPPNTCQRHTGEPLCDGTAYLDDEAWVARLEGPHARNKLRPAGASALKEARGGDAAQHLDGGARDERPPRKGGAVVPRGDARCDVLGHQHGPDGQPVGEGLGHGHEVRAEAVVRLVGPQAPAAAHARLHRVGGRVEGLAPPRAQGRTLLA